MGREDGGAQDSGPVKGAGPGRPGGRVVLVGGAEEHLDEVRWKSQGLPWCGDWESFSEEGGQCRREFPRHPSFEHSRDNSRTAGE